MSGRSPFSPRAVIALLAIGGGALLLLLYAIGAGWTGRDDRDGGAHAAANGANGFAGLARLLEARGYAVSLSRDAGRLDDEGLLVITPQIFTDAEDLDEIIEARRYVGPTLLILPKWFAFRGTDIEGLTAPEGWVVLDNAITPPWASELSGFGDAKIAHGKSRSWEGLGMEGPLPAPEVVQSLDSPSILPLVTDVRGDVLAGFLDDGGAYPVLDRAGGLPLRDYEGGELDGARWAVVVVAEPDLLNNQGMGNISRARLAVELVEASREGEDLPIVFDLTVAGLGKSANLLTLAFRPPFLAATLCLLLAALVIGWRSFLRFGPPVAEDTAIAMGKRQLAINGAALIERAGRVHLLGPPYAALAVNRIAAALGIRDGEAQAREDGIARILAQRGIAPDFTQRLAALRRARTPQELLRAAAALRTIERTLAV